jgi:hypothetical protein
MSPVEGQADLSHGVHGEHAQDELNAIWVKRKPAVALHSFSQNTGIQRLKYKICRERVLIEYYSNNCFCQQGMHAMPASG